MAATASATASTRLRRTRQARSPLSLVRRPGRRSPRPLRTGRRSPRFGGRVEETSQDSGEGEHVVDLVGKVAAPGRDHCCVFASRRGIELGVGVGQAEDHGAVVHRPQHVLVDDAGCTDADQDIGLLQAGGPGASDVLDEVVDLTAAQGQGQASIPASVLKSTDLPSITGRPASGLTSPSPRMAEPSVTIRTRLPMPLTRGSADRRPPRPRLGCRPATRRRGRRP